MSFVKARDLDFMLYDWLKADDLPARARFAEHSRDTFDAILDVSAKLAMDTFASHYKKSDREEPVLDNGNVRVIPEVKKAFDTFAEAGLCAAPFDAELGGLQLPQLIHSAVMVQFMAANVATAVYPMLSTANARVLAAYGTPAQIEAFAKPQIEGHALATMCLSEPQAGSSLADITTRAVFEADDELGARHRLFGNKMWISGGDHNITDNIIHLVLAKVPDADGKVAPGVGQISLFVVPKILPGEAGALGERNDIEVAGLNHKMGYRATTNCLLNFGEGTRSRPQGAAGAIGYRIGEVGQGLAIMFHMMNEARIAIGLGAAALAYRGYTQSLEYARERRQGRTIADKSKDAVTAQQPIIVHPDVKRMLLIQKAFAEGALSMVLYCARLVDERETAPDKAQREEAAVLLDLLTPIAKSWPSEFGLVANDMAIQIHGGYGYTRDFDVEQVYRDNRLNPIHEGTHGIQAIDLLGRKIIRDQGRGVELLGRRIAATIESASTCRELSGFGKQLSSVWTEVVEVANTLIALNDPSRALENASPFLSAFGHVVAAWMWLDQAVVITSSKGDLARTEYGQGKLHACRFLFEVELPKVLPQLVFVRSLSDVSASMSEATF
jgi:alkylation response protein AidB-like acyl-CoA dehydrogenase